MPLLCPLPVPSSWVQSHGIITTSDMFFQEHLAWRRLPDGRTIAVTLLYYRRDDAPSDRTTVVTVFDRSFAIERLLALTDLTQEMTTGFLESFDPAIGPGGELVFCTTCDRVFVLDATWERPVASYDPKSGASGCSRLTSFSSGRLVALRGENELCIASASPSTLAAGLPPLVSVVRAYQDKSGQPSLAPFDRGSRGYVGELSTLGDDRILLPLLSWPTKSGASGTVSYCVLDEAGAQVGGLALWGGDDPTLPRRYPHTRCLGHPQLDGWVMRTQGAWYVFDRDGSRAVLRLGMAEDPRFKPLAPFLLFGIGHAGELVLLRPDHHTLLVSEPIAHPQDIEPALIAMAEVYTKSFTLAKKAVDWSGRAFVAKATPIAAVAPPKAEAKPKKTRAPKEATSPATVAASAAPEQGPATTLEALCQRPRDRDLLALLAAELTAKGDPHGRYIDVVCQLERLDLDDPARPALVKQRLSLEEQHLAAWLAQWNTPHDLFRPGDMVGGFPNGVFLNKLPKDVDGLGAQLAKLPIAELHLYGLKIRDLEMVFPMPTFRHVTTLSISGTPSTKLERKLVTRLAEIVPPRLEDLAMRGVIAPGTDLRALLDQATALRSLRLSECDIDDVKLGEMAESPTARRIHGLHLEGNPLRALPALHRWAALQELNLVGCSIDDRVEDSPATEHGLSVLNLGGHGTLGAGGMAWLAATFPRLVSLALPRRLGADAIPALRPFQGTLEKLEADLLFADSVQGLVSDFLPRATRLRELCLGTVTGEVLSAALSAASLTFLDLRGGATDETLQVLASHKGAASLTRVHLTGSFTDAGLDALAHSQRLGRVRDMQLYADTYTEEGVRRLVSCEALASLRRLRLLTSAMADPCRLSVEEKVEVRGRYEPF